MTTEPEAPDRLAALLDATARGNQAAFAELYALSSPKLFALLQRILQRRDWAEDALQDCYIRIWQNAERYESARGSPMAWLATIARYRALDLLRARRPEISESALGEQGVDVLEQEDVSESPEDRAAESEGMGRLDDCMKDLPKEQRSVVLMAYYEGYTHSELASRLKMPMGTIKTWMRRSLLRLRDCLGAA